MAEFTQALANLRSGSVGGTAVNALFEAAYADLRQLAQSRLQRNAANNDHDTTSLVHESYLRFLNAVRVVRPPARGEVLAGDARGASDYSS